MPNPSTARRLSGKTSSRAVLTVSAGSLGPLLLLAGTFMPLSAHAQASTDATGKSFWERDRYVADDGSHTTATRKSVYVAVSDKTKLAVDFYLPVTGGNRKLPAIFLYTRYSRGSTNAEGGFTSTEGLKVDRDGVARLDIGGTDDAAQTGSVAQFLRHGYAVVIAEMRGAGASFGPQHHEGDDVEGRDGKDLVEWIARQPWSDGQVGMFGTSYLAEVQPRVAALKPKPLKALVMVQGFFDGANSAYAMGGIHRSGWAGAWQASVARLDNLASAKANAAITPVDADPDRRLLRDAIEDHQREAAGTDYRTYSADFTGVGVLRDKLGFIDRYQTVGANNLSTLVPKFNAANIPTLLIGGWEDLYVTDMMLWNANISVPHKLIYGPWGHGGALGPGFNPRNLEFQAVRTTEALRWFDHWLKKLPNDAMAQPALRLEVPIDQKHTVGMSSSTWPLPGAKTISYYFSPGRTRTVLSQNDGALSATAPSAVSRDNWVVDYNTSLGVAGTRWEYRRIYPLAMLPNDHRSLTYTSDPLQADMLVAGSPSLTLWLASENAPVVDIYAYLSEVDPDGTSRLVTEGMIRSSHRTLGTAPYDNLGRPFPTSNAADVAATQGLNADPALIRFPMLVMGKVFRAGSRIRVTIAGNDKDNTTTPILDVNPRLKMFLGGTTPSRIELPIAPLDMPVATAEDGR